MTSCPDLESGPEINYTSLEGQSRQSVETECGGFCSPQVKDGVATYYHSFHEFGVDVMAPDTVLGSEMTKRDPVLMERTFWWEDRQKTSESGHVDGNGCQRSGKEGLSKCLGKGFAILGGVTRVTQLSGEQALICRWHLCVLSHFSCVPLFATPWTVAHQAPLSVGFLQARTLEWIAMPSSRGSSPPRDRIHISYVF